MAPRSNIQPLKVLMLHGYTQSGQLFRAKSRALEKHIQKVFPGSTMAFPTGPLRLKPSDVPGFDASSVAESHDIEAYGWWRRSNTADPPEYVGLESGLSTVAELLATEGPFDGVAGFSQGAAFAAMICSLLQGSSREDTFNNAHSDPALSMPFPSSFSTLQHPPMKFCIVYSGFVAPGERYHAFYDPPISTPSCHFIGSLDTIVDESRCLALADAFGGEPRAQVVYHPGGHFLPSSKQFLDVAASFIMNTVQSDVHHQDQQVDEHADDPDDLSKPKV